MAYPFDTYDDTFGQMSTNFVAGQSEDDTALFEASNALVDWMMGDDHAALGEVINSATAISRSVGIFFGFDPIAPPGFEFLSLYYWDHWCRVNMANMIRAKFEAEYQEITDWVGLEWSFQQILWDQPFFPDKYTEIINRVRT